MNHLTRKHVLEFYFTFLNRLPHIGPGGLSPGLQFQWQVNDLTYRHLILNKAVDPDNDSTIARVPIVTYGNLGDGFLQLALVSKPTFSNPVRS